MKTLLNLYSGVGGNRAALSDEWRVTAVEMNPEIAAIYAHNFPQDSLIVGEDAHQYLLDHYHEGWTAIWSSPPCPTHSQMMKATRHDRREYPDMRLYQEILWLQHHYKGKWVVENVVGYYEPLIPAQICGRHLVWANFHIPRVETPKPPGFINECTVSDSKEMQKWLGIYNPGKNVYVGGNHCPNQIYRNAVAPITGKQILEAAFSPDLFGQISA